MDKVDHSTFNNKHKGQTAEGGRNGQIDEDEFCHTLWE